VRQKAPLCPNAKVPDELTQVDCPAKKQNTCPKKPIQSTFRNRCAVNLRLVACDNLSNINNNRLRVL
jgi:hypothetical protein